MPGHPRLDRYGKKVVDGRDKPGHDDFSAMTTSEIY
jgi:hypothetical protein